MKQYLLSLLLAFNVIVTTAAYSKDGYRISVKLDKMADSTLQLANYYGDKKYIKDSVSINKDGLFIFDGDESLPGGIYLIVLPDKSYFELVITADQHFSVHTGVPNYVHDMKIEGSQENLEFYEYLRFMSTKGRELNGLETKLEADSLKPEVKKALTSQMGLLNSEVQEFKVKFIESHPEHFISKVFITSRDIEIPEAPVLEDGSVDSLFSYKYYKQHFFDNVDFSNGDLLRTPVFHERIWKYMIKIVMQSPDSLCRAADRLLNMAIKNEELYKYCLITMLNKYANPKVMGQDAVYVHLVENYYATGKASWVDSTLLYRITEQAKILKPLLIGAKAPNLILEDVHGQWRNLQAVEAKYTLLIFWDPDCGHCKTTIPQVQPMLDRLGPGYDIKVFGVDTEGDKKLYDDFLLKHNLMHWINVHDHDFHNYFRSIYDLESTPRIFLLDEKKVIIAKKLTLIQLEDFFRNKKKEEDALIQRKEKSSR